MSTIAEKIADPLDAATPQMSQKEMKRRKPAGKKIYKPRIATKIKWALEDCMSRTIAAQERMRKILAWSEQQRAFYAGDDKRRAFLGDLDHEIAQLALDVSEMERILNTATKESQTPEAAGKKAKGKPVAREEAFGQGSYSRETKVDAQ